MLMYGFRNAFVDAVKKKFVYQHPSFKVFFNSCSNASVASLHNHFIIQSCIAARGLHGYGHSLLVFRLTPYMQDLSKTLDVIMDCGVSKCPDLVC